MTPDLLITSGQNPKLKDAIDLQDRKAREKTGLFLIEGYRELFRAMQGNVQIEALFFSPKHFLGSNEPALIEAIAKQGAKLYECKEEIFSKLSYRDRPDGLVAVAKKMKKTLSDLHIENVDDPLFIVAEAIEKPGNLGTILRSADAAGAHGVIVCDRCTDIYNPNVVRASTGILFTIPVIEASSEDALFWLKTRQIAIMAATPSAQQEYTETDLRGSLAIAVGTEQYGLSKKWLDEATMHVRIPMCGVADSLNVATATTLLLYEALRQRKVKV